MNHNLGDLEGMKHLFRVCQSQCETDPNWMQPTTPAPTPAAPTKSPTKSPTDSPTNSPTDSPTNSPTELDLTCETVHIGSSDFMQDFRDGSLKVVQFASTRFNCPAYVSKSNWIKTGSSLDNYDDKFKIMQTEDAIFVERVDVPHGWGLDLQIKCCEDIPRSMVKIQLPPCTNGFTKDTCEAEKGCQYGKSGCVDVEVCGKFTEDDVKEGCCTQKPDPFLIEMLQHMPADDEYRTILENDLAESQTCDTHIPMEMCAEFHPRGVVCTTESIRIAHEKHGKPIKPTTRPPIFSHPCMIRDCANWMCEDWCECEEHFPWMATLFDAGVANEYCPSDGTECICPEGPGGDGPNGPIGPIDFDIHKPWEWIDPLWDPIPYIEAILPPIICGDWVPTDDEFDELMALFGDKMLSTKYKDVGVPVPERVQYFSKTLLPDLKRGVESPERALHFDDHEYHCKV